MQVSDEQRRTFRETGLLRLPQAVPPSLVETALRAINASLGAHGIDPAELPRFRAQSYCPEVAGTAAITDLYNASPLRTVAETLIGGDRVRPIHGGQIALRFPAHGAPGAPGPHIDGMYTPTNGVERGTIASFTALVGVFLSDIPHPDMGNFSVWPGSHRVLEAHFRVHGPQSLLDGFPSVHIGAPEQIVGRAGDAVLCHYQLAHGIAGNASPSIRYGIFFRLSHADHETHKWECMTDIWREWDGMRTVLSH